MATQLLRYDVYPMVYEVGKLTKLNVRPVGTRPFANKEHKITVVSLAAGSGYSYPGIKCSRDYVATPDENGVLSFECEFDMESEYYVRIYCDDRRVAQLSVYAVESDLASRMPRVGDLHMHTYRSDGREAPWKVVADYRSYGYDFLAITDHNRYHPSLEAQFLYKDTDKLLTIVPGEEVHLPGNPVHIVNFGGKFSINHMIENDRDNNEMYSIPAENRPEYLRRAMDMNDCPDIISVEEYKRQVNELAQTLDVPEGIDKFHYAACCWIFNKIREAQGLGIYAHPYWIADVFQISEAFNEYMLDTHPFDAYEVMGGEDEYHMNGFQVAQYYNKLQKGTDSDYPIVGSTDTHSSAKTNTQGHVTRTIVFTPKNEREAIIESIKQKYSIAVDTMSKEVRPIGDFRLVKYAWFLLEHYYPAHDAVACEDGRAMHAYSFALDESEKAFYAEKIAQCKKEQERLEKKYFAFA